MNIFTPQLLFPYFQLPREAEPPCNLWPCLRIMAELPYKTILSLSQPVCGHHHPEIFLSPPPGTRNWPHGPPCRRLSFLLGLWCQLDTWACQSQLLPLSVTLVCAAPLRFLLSRFLLWWLLISASGLLRANCAASLSGYCSLLWVFSPPSS